MHREELNGAIARRAKHFFTETARVRRGVEAWEKGDLKLFGQLMTDSGRSSIENYECGGCFQEIGSCQSADASVNLRDKSVNLQDSVALKITTKERERNEFAKTTWYHQIGSLQRAGK